MQNNDWLEVGENIKQCVINAVESKDFSGLSKNIEESVSSTLGQLNNKLNGKEQTFGFNEMKSSTYGKTYTAQQKPGAATQRMNGQQAATNQTSSSQATKNQTATNQATKNQTARQVVTPNQRQIPQLYAKEPPGTYSGPVCKVLGRYKYFWRYYLCIDYSDISQRRIFILGCFSRRFFGWKYRDASSWH